MMHAAPGEGAVFRAFRHRTGAPRAPEKERGLIPPTEQYTASPRILRREYDSADRPGNDSAAVGEAREVSEEQLARLRRLIHLASMAIEEMNLWIAQAADHVEARR